MCTQRIAGVPSDKIVEAHGSFHTSTCRGCQQRYDLPWLKAKLAEKLVPDCDVCGAIVKPDITFFGVRVPLSSDGIDIQAGADVHTCAAVVVAGVVAVSVHAHDAVRLGGVRPAHCHGNVAESRACQRLAVPRPRPHAAHAHEHGDGGGGGR